MAEPRGSRRAFGHPGIEPRWTHGNKDGVGTAYAGGSRLWFTTFRGVVTEVFYPTIDRPQIRDIQYLVSDGRSFTHEEKRHLTTEIVQADTHALAYRIANTAPDGSYVIEKEVIADPHLSCLLQRTRLTGSAGLIETLHLYALCAPHLQVGGHANNAHVMLAAGQEILTAERGGVWLALGATIPFVQASCGFVGASDGATDLMDNYLLDWIFDEALDGNVALTGELPFRTASGFTLGLAFGDSLANAISTLFQSLALPFDDQRQRYIEQWHRPQRMMLSLGTVSGDEGRLCRTSYNLMLAHEDKTYPGAFIASLSIPWGEAKGDEDQGGYHLVWTRDLVNTAMGLLAAGNKSAPLRALIYLAASQQSNGRFPQNFWVDGTAYWGGIQLDEIALPILLAWRLRQEGALSSFDPYVLVKRAAGALVRFGATTQQERWEEASGCSPSTLAACIAALICAAMFCRERGEPTTAQFLEEHADFFEAHVEPWTVTTSGTLVPGIPRHFIRILPIDIDQDPSTDEDPNTAQLTLTNQPPGVLLRVPAKEVVDAGFLELVRYGIREPRDPLIVESLRVVDSVLKVETPAGPCWRRYNYDGYGQRDDGGPFLGWGRGRAWPLLTGERAHYELAAGSDVQPLIHTIERFASTTGLLPEQVWDAPDMPGAHLRLGGPTTAAMPLVWAHAEYMKLLRSVFDNQVFDFVPQVALRCESRRPRARLEVWKFDRQIKSIRSDSILRVLAAAPFMLRWSADGWTTVIDTQSTATGLEIDYVDIAIGPAQRAPIKLTFFWRDDRRWEGRDYEVGIL
jgi:glucoamylase